MNYSQERTQDFGQGVNAPLPPEAKFVVVENLTTNGEVYLNKYMVSIALFSTSACPDCSKVTT